MAKHSRRSHRKGRKSHRKSHRKGSRSAHRKSQRRQSRRQHGGGNCAAMPLNRESFAQQRGGMAPYSTGDATLLDQPTMIQAQSYQQMADITAAQALARSAAQSGGSRKGSRKHHSRRHRRTARKGRKQRGGNYPWATGLQGFGDAYTIAPSGLPTGVNAQFREEGSVNPLYGETRGAQSM